MTGPSTFTAPRVFTVRADYGKYAKDFKHGGYVAIGWLPEVDLAAAQDRDELRSSYEKYYPEILKASVIGNHVGQISRFLLEIRPGDHILTPTEDSEFVNHGIVMGQPYSYMPNQPICPYPHHRAVKWSKESLRRSDFSVPLQNTMRALLTVFEVSQANEIFTLLGRKDLVSPLAQKAVDVYEVVLERILTLDAASFEQLVAHLLAAMGFEETEHTGRSGDGGVDARGTLNISGLAKIKLFVQAKRYQTNSRINAKAIQDFRGAIPNSAQGAFITTADYVKKAHEVANDPGFPRIGLINGKQLVDLLTEHWNKLPEEMQEQIGLRPGLVLV